MLTSSERNAMEYRCAAALLMIAIPLIVVGVGLLVAMALTSGSEVRAVDHDLFWPKMVVFALEGVVAATVLFLSMRAL